MLKYLDGENRTAMASSHAIMKGCNLYADGSWWWLRTMGEDGQHVCVVWADGEVDYDGVPMELDNGMVRPVIQIRAGS